MKSVVLYDSEYGNTQHVAEAMAEELQHFGAVQVERVRDGAMTFPDDMQLLIVGGPTQVHGVSHQLREQLDAMPKGCLRDIMAGAFDTRAHGPALFTGAASHGIAKRLQQRGARLISPPESFIVDGKEGPLADGEVERARAWVRGLAAAATPALAGTGL